MKFFAALFCFTAVTVAFAQETGVKKTLIFPAGAREPIATPKPTATVAPIVATPTLPSQPATTATAAATPAPAPPRPTVKKVDETREPDEIINSFFMLVCSGKVDDAYNDLVRGSLLADRAEILENLKKNTAEAIEKFGPVRGFEEISTIKAGERLIRKTCLAFNSDSPLRWRFYFYKPDKYWKLIDLRIDDALAQLIEDNGTAPAQSR